MSTAATAAVRGEGSASQATLFSVYLATRTANQPKKAIFRSEDEAYGKLQSVTSVQGKVLSLPNLSQEFPPTAP